MKSVGVFDILGPIMVGPSSSHTAGAARLGKVARSVANGPLKSVKFLLHGSFGKSSKGHGTDRLRESLEIAKREGLEFEFIETDLGDAHPNTVKFIMETKKGNYCEVIGSSIGGGSIQITEVNGNKVEFTGDYPTLIISHQDVPGAVSNVTSILYKEHINIAFMKVFRKQRGKGATMVFEVDNRLNDDVIDEIKGIDSISRVIRINPVKEEE